MPYTTIIQHKGRTITLGYDTDDNNGGGFCVYELDIDGKDCTPALGFGNLTEVFEELLIKEGKQC